MIACNFASRWNLFGKQPSNFRGDNLTYLAEGCVDYITFWAGQWRNNLNDDVCKNENNFVCEYKVPQTFNCTGNNYFEPTFGCGMLKFI